MERENNKVRVRRKQIDKRHLHEIDELELNSRYAHLIIIFCILFYRFFSLYISICFVCFFFFFFFSSRRRHTRWTGDWSSDVCSSDLAAASPATAAPWR